MNQIDLTGRCALITGAARGTGYAMAERLLRSGATVCIWDIDQVALVKAGKELAALGRVVQAEADVSDAVSVASAVAASLKALEKIDILINNAGITGPNHKTWEYPIEEFRRVLEVDLMSAFMVCRAVLPHMIERGYGRIVNIASVAGKEGNPNASAYSAAKGGMIALTKSLGKELVGTGVIVNCVTPAAAKTAIFDQMSAEHIQYMLSKIPMGRFVELSEVAALVAWLVSEECSFSTGAVFDISGGRATY
jgi:2-dehydro-3-deoxy-L-rhamnonate dehydrogenase (NAD+)